MKNNIKRKKNRQTGLTVFLIILAVLIIFPFWMLVSISLSAEADIVKYGYSIIPKNIDFSAYEYVFKKPEAVLNAYKITGIYSVISMVLSVLFMAMLAYPLTERKMKGKGAISFYLYFTMLFSGGLVPLYILNTRYLHLDDTIWIYIIPGMISPWYVFMMRTFFQGIPTEISESARIDGAGTYTIFFKMILPLSKPVLATVALFTFLGKWNDWYTAMLYRNDESLISLQYLLQRIMENIELLNEISSSNLNVSLSDETIPAETVRMAMAVIVAGPALIVFPFFQKYFVKGMTVGSVKG